MPAPVLATKLYVPSPRSKIVARPHLVERLNEGLRRAAGVTLISASAGFGKTTLVSEWIASLTPNLSPSGRGEVAWLSLDEGDNDPARFLTYFVAALQTIAPTAGLATLALLQSPQPPPSEAILTTLLNDIAAISDDFVLVLDDYHVIEAKAIDQLLTFLIEHLPPHMQLVIATREDPQLPLARLRVRGQLTELRAADLRFTPTEAAEFLNHTMGLDLSADDVAALENRTEGWIAGLQLAALALQGTLALHSTATTPGREDASNFIEAFTGSHHFVLDYLVEEVLRRQSADVQTFLLHTSILDRLCGPLCEAVLSDPHTAGQATLEYLERANLFIVPLDNERCWYRYHHLFGGFLRQRLQHQSAISPTELHIRASAWYEANDLELEAFQQAVAAHDIDRAARLVEGKGMPLHFRGAAVAVLHWLGSLSTTELDVRPALWVAYASALLFISQVVGVEQKLQAAEATLQGVELDAKTRDLIGHIASVRATVAVTQHDVDAIITQSRRALEYLHPDNLPVRTATIWTLGYAYQLQGDRAAASEAYTEAIAISQAIGHFIINLMATLGLATLQAADNQLLLADQTYRHALQLAGDPPLPVACDAHLGLARLCYEWNNLEAAEQHGQESLRLARQIENTDRAVACEAFLARLALARGDVAGALTRLAQADRAARQRRFVQVLPEVVALQVLTLLHHGKLTEAAQLAQANDLPLSQTHVLLAQGNPSAALTILRPFLQQMETRGWQAERLNALVLQAIALRAQGDLDKAAQAVHDALTLAEPGGFIRLFVDEGEPMRLLIADVRLRIEKRANREGQKLIGYADKLLAAFGHPALAAHSKIQNPKSELLEPLTQRELEILQLIAQGLSNREISERLFLALDTVKGHNRRIFDKLHVQRRTEAIARARELGLL